MIIYESFFKAFLLGIISLVILVSTGYSQNDPIKIAFVGDFSDVAKVYSEGSFEAARMAVSEFNADGGLLGRPVILIQRDGGNDPARHYEHITALADRENVVAVFGGASSDCLLKASEASRERQIPYLISIGNSQSVVVEKGHPFVFLFEANSWMDTKGFSIFTTLMPWQRYAWLGPDYSWGREVFQYFKHHFEEIGNPIEWATEAWHPLDADNFQALIRQILDTKPDALIIASWGEDMRRFIVQAKPFGLFNNMAVFGWFMSESTGRLLPEGIWTLNQYECK